MTKELNKMLRVMLENVLLEINTSLPATVINYDSGKQIAKVKPSFKRKLKDGQEFNLPDIFNVPVVFPRGGDFALHFPLSPGDRVLIIIAQRSLDKWQETGATLSPDGAGKFQLSDAIALPGLYPKSEPINIKGDKEALVLQTSNGYLEIKKDGSIKLKNNKAEINASKDGKFKLTNGSTELLDQISTLIQNLLDAKVITGIGDQPFTPDTTVLLEERKAKITEIKG